MARDARARLERLEAKLRPRSALPSLGAMERRELAQLEASYRSRFAGDPDTWSMDRLDEYIAYSCSDSAGRLGELRFRDLPAAEQAELRATRIAIEAMTADELDEWMAGMVRAAQEEN